MTQILKQNFVNLQGFSWADHAGTSTSSTHFTLWCFFFRAKKNNIKALVASLGFSSNLTFHLWHMRNSISSKNTPLERFVVAPRISLELRSWKLQVFRRRVKPIPVATVLLTWSVFFLPGKTQVYVCFLVSPEKLILRHFWSTHFDLHFAWQVRDVPISRWLLKASTTRNMTRHHLRFPML